ncbi:hypothetical protein D9613_006362 [Agrocybe pediades]|uniref:Nephrocystin 3-like N-terminal domain-containing protein n=1 Tax=Agrocybe pediades TaxID=84607 RepID=A0A8H4QUV7_9AGAR|nr:hypothetical protein D9613_006362 [Agrocybe pediades]
MLPSSPMISSQQAIVTGGQFIQNNYHGGASMGNKAPIDLLTEAVAPNAFHDSAASFDKPKCHPKTRVKILEIIMHWILGKYKEVKAGKQFMWLNGAAGCGKSAIAQSTIESCIEQGVLLASFFFNRSDTTRNHAGPLVATLVYQLYCAFPETAVQTEILSAIKKDPLIFKKTVQQQFTSLIIRPLTTHFSKDRSAQRRVPFLIVIDGLDECADRTAQRAVLTGLAESMRDFNLLVFVASRPEHDIRLSFGSKYLENMHTGLSLDLRDDGDDADSDIRLYLFDRFAQIKDDFNKRTTGRKLAQDWPGDWVIETLVRKSSHQFIYAGTVIRYVESTRHRPDHRLDIILDHQPGNGDHPFSELDSLYAMIFESVLDIEKVLHVLSLHLMHVRRIRCSVIEKMLSYDEGEVETLFCDMGALVQLISKPADPRLHRDQEYDSQCSPSFLRILHASLGDYLLEATRSKKYHIDMEYERIRHVTHALQYLASCCSSSFDPTHFTAAPVHILDDFKQHLKRSRIGQITFPLELQQSALSFPLKEFLEPHISTPTYPYLLQLFVTPFLELLETMVLYDRTLSHIQDRQLGILRSVLMPQIQQYLNNDRLTLVVVLFYYIGSHRFIPILQHPNSWHSRSIPFYYVGSVTEWGDILSLSYIWGHSNSLFPDISVFHCYVRQLLCDPGRTAEYVLGPGMHEKAALACFKELGRKVLLLRLPESSGNNFTGTGSDGTEDDANPKLNFYSRSNGGEWRFGYYNEATLDNEEFYFVLLGYLIFLLPRCGRSDALVAACEEHGRMAYIDQPDCLFPVRRRLLHKEITNYLARVLYQLHVY